MSGGWLRMSCAFSHLSRYVRFLMKLIFPFFTALACLLGALPFTFANVLVNTKAAGGNEPFLQKTATVVTFRYDDPQDQPDKGSQDVILVAFRDLNHGALQDV